MIRPTPTASGSPLKIPGVGFLRPQIHGFSGPSPRSRTASPKDGFVKRYDTTDSGDVFTAATGVFLAWPFWLVDAVHLAEKQHEATELFESLLNPRNDIGLLSEEWGPTPSGRTTIVVSDRYRMSPLRASGGSVDRTSQSIFVCDDAPSSRIKCQNLSPFLRWRLFEVRVKRGSSPKDQRDDPLEAP